MKRTINYKLVFALSSAVLLFSCQKDVSKQQDQNLNSLSANKSIDDLSEYKSMQNQKYNTFKGPEMQMGNGKVRSWISISHTGVPQEIGVELTDDALKGLPTSVPEGEEINFIIPLHKKAGEVTAFDHLEIDWNPFGHPPPGIYDKPHFDFHFYKITVAEQMAIPPYTPATASLFDMAPAPGYLPAIYQPIPGGVPEMGKHWFDPSSPEWQGQPFTSTFIYGTYKGAVTFFEPMITMAVLQSGQSFHIPFPQPTRFAPDHTYYPTQYNIYEDSNTHKHYVTLSNFVLR